MNSHVPSNAPWTDEKHVHFLNSMEAWFVRTMFENNSDRYNLRLDRQLPDSSDSTLDCKHHNVPTRKKHASSADSIGTTRSKMKVKTDKRLKRPPPQRPPPPPPQSQPHDSSPDQVVPQVGNGTEDKD
ncbi:putative FAD-binding Berberine family protein [Hibiscus syriacus]|uniref:FAD-binding Berberine family protein n=1 Tax=Hibiscus syriacus TaxID=106335 RepID=A0A6A3B0K6_HIBSY|nr:uncharacterized protein LOC120118711 isoform X1 [Hibiscus syriacus]KAE8709713.1 putative FAD-binding Berberine family protein [Hibiscus syriacus]